MTAAGQTINDRLVLKQVLEGARNVQRANHHIGRTERKYGYSDGQR